MATELDPGTVRRLAVAAETDPRSIVRELRAARGEGAHVRGMAGARARRVLAQAGLIHEQPDPPRAA